MDEKKLEGKVIVISGGTKGVGRAAAEEFARQGAKVVIGGRDKGAAMKTLQLIRTYGSAGIFVHTDLEKVDDCIKPRSTYSRSTPTAPTKRGFSL